jgi:UDP-N-acetylmuramate dehydrogenase
MNDILHYLQKKKIKHFHDEEIKPYVTMKIGGRVKLIVIVKKNVDLQTLGMEMLESEWPYVLIGGGSNVIFSDGFSPIVVIINRTADIAQDDNHTIRINSGVPNRSLTRWCIKNGISGMEFLAGIPGSIGGAAAVNAGAFGRSVSDILESAEIIDEKGDIQRVSNHYFQYQYRSSIFKKGNQILLNVFLRCQHSEPSRIVSQVNSNLKYRKENHPSYRQFTAGCFFKNPFINNQRISAGKIIERLQLKGKHFPNLRISDKHANFIINKGKAGFHDLCNLEQEICQTVLEDNNVLLEREVIYISPDGKKN